MENLERVLQEGLIPRSDLDELGEPFVANDQYRGDGHRECTSVSIEFPNCWMLSTRIGPSGEHRHVVLYLSVSIADTPGTLCSPWNAARKGASVGLAKLLIADLYKPTIGDERQPPRAPTRLRSAPTSLQAELLIPDWIGPEYIVGVATASPGDANHASELGADPVWLSPYLYRSGLEDLVQRGKRPRDDLYRTEL